MAKSLYSLMLSDEVVSAVDRLALRAQTNRSNLINQILAEYCSLLTPEKRIAQIFEQVERFFDGSELAAFLTPHQPTMLLKTSLNYRYRPTIRYELRLYAAPVDTAVGELHVSMRTQSAGLISLMEEFFNRWIPIEAAVQEEKGIRPSYSLSAGRFDRTIHLPAGNDAEQVSGAIAGYVQLLDGAMKQFIDGSLPEKEMADLIKKADIGI